jgi:hypothetical protein
MDAKAKSFRSDATVLAWRNSRQLMGVRSQLVAAINSCDDGAQIKLDIKSAQNLVEVCDQALHTERGHGV